MDEKPTVKMVSVDKVKELKKSLPPKPTAKEQQFIDSFMESGNGTQAALFAFKCTSKKSGNTIGSRLIKKFGIERFRKTKAIAEPDSINRTDPKEGYIDGLEKAFKTNSISFEEMYNDMYKIAKTHPDATVRIRAYDWMYEKRKVYDEEVKAREMEAKDITTLMSEALGALDRVVYLDVLKETRKIRLVRIGKRNEKIDPWKIINEQRNLEKDTSNIVNLYTEEGNNESN